MIVSYLHNTEVHMTKDTYFEMCEALGSEPIDSEIPVEMEDFPHEVQQAFNLYFMLRDQWDTMGGSYLGKDTSTLFQFFELYGIEKHDQLLIIDLVQHMDYTRRKSINDRKPSNKKPSSK